MLVIIEGSLMEARMNPIRQAAAMICLVAFVAPATSVAREWHVASDGSGDGSEGAPFGAIQDGLDAAEPGDRVIVAAGEYAESLETARDGEVSAPIAVVAADPDDAPLITASGRVLRVDHAYHVFEGLVFDGQYGDRDALDVNDGAESLLLLGCEVRRSGRDCVDMGAPANVLIEGCLIHHCLNSAEGRTDAHGVTGGAMADLTIRDTEIHTFSGDAIQLDPGREEPGWTRLVIEGCSLWLEPLPEAVAGFDAGIVPGENAVDTKTWEDAPRAELVIRDTVMWGFRGGLIPNMAALNLKENIDATVDRVTIFDSEIAFRLRGPTSSRPAGARVRVSNAVVYDVDVALRYENDIEDLRVWHSTFGADVGQLFHEASADESVLDVRDLLVLGAALPDEASGASNLTVDADCFVDVGEHDYHLAEGCAAIDAGEVITEVTVDRDGVERPVGEAVDIGAYEHCPGGCDVGPDGDGDVDGDADGDSDGDVDGDADGDSDGDGDTDADGDADGDGDVDGDADGDGDSGSDDGGESGCSCAAAGWYFESSLFEILLI